jgi:hypothetical protein
LARFGLVIALLFAILLYICPVFRANVLVFYEELNTMTFQTEAFGKIIFIPTSREVPPIPEMKLLVGKGSEDFMPYRALCIDLEMDACGDSVKTACDNLKKSIDLFLFSEIETWGSVQVAAQHITDTAYEETARKSEDFREYRRMKYAHIQNLIRKNISVGFIQEEIDTLRSFEKKSKISTDLPFITELTEQRVA